MDMRFCIWLLLTILFAHLCYSKNSSISIGGVFHEDNYEDEIAFKYAVDRINMYNHNTMIEPIIHRVSKHDPFKTGKIVCNMTEQGVAAIFGPQSSACTSIVQSICKTLEIPHLQTNWIPNMQSHYSQTVLNLYPEPSALAKAYADLLRAMNWNSYTIIYETDEGLMRLQEVLQVHGPQDFPVTVKQLGPGPDYRPLLKEIKNSTETQFILDCETDHILEILKQAKDVQLLEDYHSYILTSLDSHTLDFGDLQIRGTNITTMRLVDPDKSEVYNAVRDWELGESNHNRRLSIRPDTVKVSTALIYDAVNLFASVLADLSTDRRNIVTVPMNCDDSTTPWEFGLGLTNFMKLKGMPRGLTGFVKFDAQGRRSEFELQVIELTKDIFRKTATWNSVIKPLRTEMELQQQIEENLRNKTLIVTSKIGPPYLMYRANHEKYSGNERYEGYAIELIDGISKILNFTYRFELVPDDRYGNYDTKTKSWNGLVRQLLDRKADLAICDLTITYERRTAVDFTMPFMTLGISILYSVTKREAPDLFSFMQPLSLEVWLYMATAYLGVSIMIFVIARMAPGDWENPHPCNHEPEELENIWSLKNSLWLTLGSIMAQGCDILPKGVSTRMVAGMWWFFSLIMTASYTANLAAFLTMERMGPTIESAEDLAKQTKIKYGAVTDGSTASFFKYSNVSTYKRMWMQMESSKPSVFVQKNPDGKERVLKSKKLYAFFMESTTIEYEVERNCDLMQVGGLLDSKGYGIAMPVNFPYRTAISGAVLKMQEDGKLLNLKNRWWKEKGGGKCKEANKGGSEAATELKLDNVGGVFVVLGVGVCIAFIIAILEFLWNVRKVAVDEHLPFSKALAIELKFAMNVFVTKKKAKPVASESSNTSSRGASETRSLAQNALRSAGSFLHLDVFDKASLRQQK